jgi:hypothetical protein
LWNTVEDADRLFLVQFLESLKYFTDIAPVVLQKTASETDPNALSIYAAAFANAGIRASIEKIFSLKLILLSFVRPYRHLKVVGEQSQVS